MDYVPSFCLSCGGELADWNKSGYCSRTKECRRDRLRAVSGLDPSKFRADVPTRENFHCLNCGEPIGRGISNYCHRTAECARQYGIEQRLRYKTECFAAYGGARCACCGESRFYFLTLDHTTGGGTKERETFGKGNGIYSRLRRAGFPDPDKYQVLCFNCNGAKHGNELCPCAFEQECDPISDEI